MLEAIHAARGTLLLSSETFAELASRLFRPKFDRYVDRPARERFLAALASVGTWVEITGTLRLCRDPDDDKFLEVALLGRADCLITGDNDLLVHDPFQGVVVCRPHVFLDRLRASQDICR